MAYNSCCGISGTSNWEKILGQGQNMHARGIIYPIWPGNISITPAGAGGTTATWTWTSDRKWMDGWSTYTVSLHSQTLTGMNWIQLQVVLSKKFNLSSHRFRTTAVWVHVQIERRPNISYQPSAFSYKWRLHLLCRVWTQSPVIWNAKNSDSIVAEIMVCNGIFGLCQRYRDFWEQIDASAK